MLPSAQGYTPPCAGGRLCCSGQQAHIMETSLKMAEPFILGCPACLQNFRNLFCTIVCSPDQATFANVTSVQQAPPAPSSRYLEDRTDSMRGGSASKHPGNVTAVAEVAFYLSEEFKNATFDSCRNVVFGAANTRSMLFIGNGATTAQVRVQCCSTGTARARIAPASIAPDTETPMSSSRKCTHGHGVLHDWKSIMQPCSVNAACRCRASSTFLAQ